MRRFESVELLDATTARRKVSCHLRLDAFKDDLQWPLMNGELLLPLARLRRYEDGGRRSRTMLWVTDEAGAQVPTLTSVEERTLVNAGVWQSARHVLRRAPKQTTTARIGAIVLGRSNPESIGKCDPLDSALAHDEGFRGVLLEAHERYFLIVPLVPGNHGRRVITYSFDEQPKFDSLRLLDWRRVLKPQPGPVAIFPVPSVADCHSYHFELVAPPDVAIPAGCGRLEIHRAFADKPDPPILEDDHSDRRLHVFFDGEGPVSSAVVQAQFVPATSGLTLSIGMTVIVSTLLILIANAVVWLAPMKRLSAFDRGALVTLLLVGPAIATTILAIRSRHEFSSRMSWGSKATLMLPTLGLFGASLAMTAGPPIMWLLELTWGLALLAALLSVVRLINERRWVRAVRKGKV